MRLETWHAPAGEEIPDHPSLPVLVYREVGDDLRELFGAHGWGGSWVNGVFEFHHFHSTSHEVLGVLAGSATLERAYPAGQEDYDLLRRADDAARARIARLPAPDRDPVGGEGISHWR